jgi:hypothetical protein
MKSNTIRNVRIPTEGGPLAALPRALRTVLPALLCLATLAACATTANDNRDQLIPQRAQARWDALLGRDYAAAYAYATPGYRSSTSLTDFEIEVRSRRVSYTGAEYREHRCEDAACTVNISVEYTVVRPAAGIPEWQSTSMVQERWIYSEGEWWFLPEK